jgi:hypothetical protein
MSERLSKFVIIALKELMNSFFAAERLLSEMILIISEFVIARFKIISVTYFVQRLSFLKNGISINVFNTELFLTD